MTDEEFKIEHPTPIVKPGPSYPSGRPSVKAGYECPCCGTERLWKEGTTECKNCGAHLKPVIEVQAHGVNCKHED